MSTKVASTSILGPDMHSSKHCHSSYTKLSLQTGRDGLLCGSGGTGALLERAAHSHIGDLGISLLCDIGAERS